MNRPIPRLLLLLVLVAGCDPGAGEPKEPAWGKQPCEYCAMLLSDKEHGAQLVTVEQERLFFDDLGCLAAWTLTHPQAELHAWVRTADTQEWVPARSAGYARRDRTPMGFGFVAVSKDATASWSQVAEAVQQKVLLPGRSSD